MRPHERENSLYKGGKRCQISNPEQILFEYLDKYVKPGGRVLDIGCGSGEITQKIREKRQLVAGLDFSSVAIDLGGSLVRNNINIRLAAENCETNLFGFYMVTDSQLIDNHTNIDHAKPLCRSNELYSFSTCSSTRIKINILCRDSNY